MTQATKPFNVVEASLEDIQTALSTGIVTSVQLVAEYLRRISIYDCRGISLNSVPIINPHVFDEAAASDDRRSAGTSLGPLDGIPYTVKDSYKVQGMTVANGAPAFENVIANSDAFTVQALREAGAVMIGRTNMPPMAAGGMQRGVYGRAESPYNLEYLAAAFASGSSNGSAVSTAASFAAFGLGEETVSSGRSPASNNAVVAYTPSRGNISIRGNWPLYSLCDVVVPHTRTVSDLFGLLDVIAQPDATTKGDFWRHQSITPLPKPWSDKPSSFYELRNGAFSKKLRIAVPEMYIKGTSQGPDDMDGVYVSDSVRALWQTAKADLESIGADIIPVADFPVVTEYEAHAHIGSEEKLGMPKNWKQVERAQLPALAWQEFLEDNADPNLKSLHGLDPHAIWPFTDRSDPQVQFSKPGNALHWDKLSQYVIDLAANDPPVTSVYQFPGMKEAVTAVEAARKSLLEDWMTEHNYDFVIFPAAGDVGRADADVDVESSRHAWTNGVKYSNGNQALRHLGVPSVTVPMGNIADKGMPVGLTIIGTAYDDVNILRMGYLYEQASKRRTAPPLTPSLPTTVAQPAAGRYDRPRLEALQCNSSAIDANSQVQITISGRVSLADNKSIRPTIALYIDGQAVAADDVQIDGEASEGFTLRCNTKVTSPPKRPQRNKVQGKIARDQIMVLVLASVEGGKPSGWLHLLE